MSDKSILLERETNCAVIISTVPRSAR